MSDQRGDVAKRATVSLHCSFGLPPDYRQQDILAFHQRDTQEVAERVVDSELYKGLRWRGHPACLKIAFEPDRAEVTLAVDLEADPHKDTLPPDSRVQFECMARRMLGLTQPVEQFDAQYAAHPLLGSLIRRRPGLRVAMTSTPFEALTWAIIGQQISVSAAVSIRRKLIQTANIRHTGGLLCYPDAQAILGIPDQALLQAGLSRTKAQTIKTLSEAVVSEELQLDQWVEDLNAEMVSEHLNAVKGIGPWTVSYALMRGFGWLDGSLHGDVAVRRNLQALLGRDEKLTQQETQRWLADYSPWRALVGAHLWAIQAADGY